MANSTLDKDMMLDLETLGLLPGCTVLSVSAIVFDRYTGETGDSFNEIVSRDSCQTFGLTEEEHTVNWWREQSDAAHAAVFSSGKGKDLNLVLLEFTRWFQRQVQGRKMHVWANSPQFDMCILEHCFRACGMEAPWKYWLLRDVRTIKDVSRSKARIDNAPEFERFKHIGLYDCKAQIVMVSCFFKERNKRWPWIPSDTGYRALWIDGIPIAILLIVILFVYCFEFFLEFF